MESSRATQRKPISDKQTVVKTKSKTKDQFFQIETTKNKVGKSFGWGWAMSCGSAGCSRLTREVEAALLSGVLLGFDTVLKGRQREWAVLHPGRYVELEADSVHHVPQPSSFLVGKFT